MLIGLIIRKLVRCFAPFTEETLSIAFCGFLRGHRTTQYWSIFSPKNIPSKVLFENVRNRVLFKNELVIGDHSLVVSDYSPASVIIASYNIQHLNKVSKIWLMKSKKIKLFSISNTKEYMKKEYKIFNQISFNISNSNINND